ncbi:regulator of microtubule dynamics protein 1-like [Liolophura sinensis]|uniref:regulator of microtubule dynamics protein 1-like n=1 Tax=Liolophura sinensis TaxID=3198878 RepID=UPI0031588F73
MTSAASSRVQFMLTTARQMSFRMRQRAQQTRAKLGRFVEGEASAVTMFLSARPNYYLVPVLPSLAFFKSTSSPQSKEPEGNAETNLIQEADKLYDRLDTEQLYALLMPYSQSENADIVWRLARAMSDKAKLTDDKEVKKTLLFDALKYAERALELDDQNFACHKWYAILLHYVGEFQSTKQSIVNSYLIRDHFKKAIELNPSDATSIHSLGNWCYVVADLPWYQRKIASVVFATPPTSSFEEALGYFLQAEKVDPNFYSINHLLIGKCHLKLNNPDLAREFLSKARDNKGKSVDDEKARKEAVELLKQIPQAS